MYVVSAIIFWELLPTPTSILQVVNNKKHKPRKWLISRKRLWNNYWLLHACLFIYLGSREQAFVFALSSAALTQSISRACAVGATTKCSCGRLPDEAPPGDFKWGGCGDNLQFGLAFARMFAEGTGSRKPKKISKKTLVNNHNNNAGRGVSDITDNKGIRIDFD